MALCMDFESPEDLKEAKKNTESFYHEMIRQIEETQKKHTPKAFANKNAKIAVSMIVRNESEMILKCLESVKDADEFQICDTGSEDDTCEKVKEFLKGKRGKLHHFKWIDDFAAARNYVQSKVKSKFVLIIDADEVLTGGMDKIKRMIQKPVNCIDINVETCGESMVAPRIFLSSLKWHDAIHNRIDYKGTRNYLDVLITGTSSPSHAKDPDRSKRILEKQLQKHPNNARWLYYYAREWLNRGELEKAIHYLERYIYITPPTTEDYFTNQTGEVFFLLGHCYGILGQPLRAIDSLFHAIKLNPNHKDAWTEIYNNSTNQYQEIIRKFMNLADNSQVLFNRKLK